MSRLHDDPAYRCPQCKGSGRVLLLFSWADCEKCGGTGLREEDEVDTGKYPVPPSGDDGGSESKLEGEDDPDYFDDGLDLDDGLEFDDHVPYGDPDAWEPGDSCTDLWYGED